MRSGNWNDNTALAAEAATVPDLFKSVVENMRGFNEAKIVMHTDYCKVW